MVATLGRLVSAVALTAAAGIGFGWALAQRPFRRAKPAVVYVGQAAVREATVALSVIPRQTAHSDEAAGTVVQLPSPQAVEAVRRLARKVTETD